MTAESKLSDDYVHTLRGFVPDYLVSTVGDCDSLRPYSKNFRGVCLIVDISGFTRLSGTFCSLGTEGIDMLQSIINEYMGLLVQMIYQYGGDIIKFAGDALLCIFAPDNDGSNSLSLMDCVVKAISCAWIAKDEESRNLTVHIGIGIGELCFGGLGGCQNRWEFLISGPCLSQLSQCLDDAPSKHVAITPELLNYLESITIEDKGFEIKTKVLATGNALLKNWTTDHSKHFDLSEDLRKVSLPQVKEIAGNVSNFVPPPVIQALGAGTLHFLPELRQVTTLFMKWDGYSETTHSDLISLQKMFYSCQEVLNLSGGFLRQFLVDDKGCVLIAMWGMPSATFADNIVRALWAAVKLSITLKESNMSTSCGISTGTVYCGTIGNQTRRAYAAIGNAVNMAARLMGKAKGHILVDEDSYDRLPESVQSKLERVADMKVKGRDEPIRPYKYSPDDAFPLSFVDIQHVESSAPVRAIVKETFRSLVQYLNDFHNYQTRSSASCWAVRVATGHRVRPRFLLIESPVGAGSSHAIAWLKHETLNSDFKVFTVMLSKLDGTADYSTMQKLFRLLIGEENYDDAARQTFVANQLLREVYPHSSETVERVAYPAMRRVLGVTCPLAQKNRKQAPMDGLEKANKIPPKLLLQTVQDLFKYLIAQHPVLLVIEHVDFMDEMSWKVLQSFTQIYSRAVFVLTKRDTKTAKESNMISKQKPAKATATASLNRRQSTISREDFRVVGNALTFHWVEPNCRKLLLRECASSITLRNYTYAEVRSFLTQSLNLFFSTSLPPGLDTLVFLLSGGNPFWVTEIIEYIRIHGANNFVTLTTDDAIRSQTGVVVLPTPPTRRSESPRNSRRSVAPISSKRIGSRYSREFAVIDLSNLEPSDKLSFFVLSRFALLAIDEQSVARSASIIGLEFTEDVLEIILPPMMKQRLPLLLLSLLQNKWVRIDYFERDDVMVKNYVFIHPMIHHVIYHLTPLGMRKQVHDVIANYLEDHPTNEEDHLINVARHYGLAEVCSIKTFDLFIRAANDCISSTVYGVDECVDIIENAFNMCITDEQTDLLAKTCAKALERARREELEFGIDPRPHGLYNRLLRWWDPQKVYPIANQNEFNNVAVLNELIAIETKLKFKSATSVAQRIFGSVRSSASHNLDG